MNDAPLIPLSPILYEPVVRRALEEDLGRAGDLTTDALIPMDAKAKAEIVARAPGRLAGLDIALAAFAMVDGSAQWRKHVEDGADMAAGQRLATVHGPARCLLTAERVALNLLGCLCGVATTTRLMAERVAAYRARIVCTRKTLPGLRALQKYAVRAGGGVNHRFGLDDAILIKDNHLALCADIGEAVRRARAYAGHTVMVEVEVDTLDQLRELLKTDADAVLLDNMPPGTLKEAVAMVAGRMTTEASGGVTPDTVAAVAASGVDYISAGFITHSAPNLDVGLDFQIDP